MLRVVKGLFPLKVETRYTAPSLVVVTSPSISSLVLATPPSSIAFPPSQALAPIEDAIVFNSRYWIFGYWLIRYSFDYVE
ncbi:hypothetical protein Patl1_30258 [Pistacia atlantica]|uniref:Uncharacterized protein n=1 Tax=Pistacia atlantica TaxID=434234 RepID=A0ACC1A9J0_9ROSI|nr:hypothetical protein Patl1_30258 [Pistacia atlantica]